MTFYSLFLAIFLGTSTAILLTHGFISWIKYKIIQKQEKELVEKMENMLREHGMEDDVLIFDGSSVTAKKKDDDNNVH